MSPRRKRPRTMRRVTVSRKTYERLKEFCAANNISMNEFVEKRVGKFLGLAEDTNTVALTVPLTPPLSRMDSVVRFFLLGQDIPPRVQAAACRHRLRVAGGD